MEVTITRLADLYVAWGKAERAAPYRALLRSRASPAAGRH
jgi:hypothetical protein